MERRGTIAGGIAFATLLAGPIFVASNVLAGLYLELPQTIDLPAREVGIFLVGLPLAILPGTLLSILPNIIGAKTMEALADRWPWARPIAIWMLAGAALGFIPHLVTRGALPAPGDFALCFTSALCAGLCRRSVRWDDAEPAATLKPASAQSA